MADKEMNRKYVRVYYKKRVLASFYAYSVRYRDAFYFLTDVENNVCVEINSKYVDIIGVYDSPEDEKCVTYNYFSLLDHIYVEF